MPRSPRDSTRARRKAARRAEDFLPLKSTWLHILVSVAAGHRHGYVIRQEVERRTDGKVRLWPATLYGALAQLTEAGLLESAEAETAEAADDDARRRYYALTPLGRKVLEAELHRLEELVRVTRSGLMARGSGNA
jgi:DNA-binding PadR family transcriptional regulator